MKNNKTQVQKYVRVLDVLECLTMNTSNTSNKNASHLTHLTRLTTLTEISILTTLTHLTTKDIILLLLLEPDKLINISKKTNIKLNTLSAMIDFKSRGSGLLIDDLVEINNINKGVNYYVTTMKGINHLVSILEYEVNRRKELETIEMEGLNTQQRIEKFKTFFERYHINEKQKLLNINFNDLSKFSPELAEFLLDSPDDCLLHIKESLSDYDNIKVRFKELSKERKMCIRNMRSIHLNHLYEIEGIVRQKGDVRPQTTSARFSCPSCGNIINILQLDSSFKEPIQCGCGRKGKFKLESKELIDAQGLVLEEEPYELEAGQQPKRLNIFLKDDLVSPISDKKTEVGTKIKIVGMLKEVPIITRQGTKSTRFDLIFEANHVEQADEGRSSLELKGDDEKNIIALSKKKNIFEILASSLLPDVHGHKEVKEGLLIQQMGGVKKERMGSTIRGDTHIILVGDPGTAKSQIIRRISQIAPKASFVSGTGISDVGITASVVKDELFKKGYSLEAGAMVLMNNGGICLDEMDKANPEHLKSLHTPMEQQVVIVNKANIHATLKSETWVLANANPKFGRFNPYGIISEQINFSVTLLNRFDVIFIIKDIPDEKGDGEMADFILDMHKGKKKKTNEQVDDELLRKYISYARKNFKPKLTDEASEEIKKFYVKMRTSDKNDAVKNIALNARQIDGLVRLSEGCAKVRLSMKVLKEDAQRAIKLLMYTLEKIGIDPNTNKIDMDRISTGISASTRDVFGKVIIIIKKLEEDFGEIIPIEEIIKLADQYGINDESVDNAISKLKIKGDLFEPVNGKISRIK